MSKMRLEDLVPDPDSCAADAIIHVQEEPDEEDEEDDEREKEEEDDDDGGDGYSE